MLFLTYWFVLFLVVTLPVYWLVRWPRFRLVWLLGGCVVFHGHFAGPAGVVPIVVLGVATYLAGLSRRRWACVVAIVLCVAALVFYKYTQFACQELLAVIWPHAGKQLYKHLGPLVPEAPPLAISFFAFEFVHYLVDVYRGHDPIRAPVDFALFAVFWPSIVAGPVKRYAPFIASLRAGLGSLATRDVAFGLVQVAQGLVKKFVADLLTGAVKFYTPQYAGLTVGERWLFLAAIGLRILLDFSGYSDMAIGFARLLGVRLAANFRWPYLAGSLVDFWHRWHISLSSWIRDYVYIPLGGSRCGTARKVANGLIAFGLCGLWHGAAFHFLVWGVYHGVGLAVASNFRTVRDRLVPAHWRPTSPAFRAGGRVLGWALTLLFVHVGWLFFFFPLGEACRMAQGLVQQ